MMRLTGLSAGADGADGVRLGAGIGGRWTCRRNLAANLLTPVIQVLKSPLHSVRMHATLCRTAGRLVVSELPKITKVKVEGLQGTFNYELNFPPNEDTIIIIAPNGFGKTALLSLLRDCVSLNLRRAQRHTFQSLRVSFSDGNHWEFTKSTQDQSISGPDSSDFAFYPEYESVNREHIRRSRGLGRSSRQVVTFSRLDSQLNEIPDNTPSLEKIDFPAFYRLLERESDMYLGRELRNLMLHRDPSRPDDILNVWSQAFSDPSIRSLIATRNPALFWPDIKVRNCLFIETQRILYSKPESSGEKEAGPQEEILRQAQTLSALLQKNYADYASTSQALDRTFPNRLIERAQKGDEIDANKLKDELTEIENRRELLTDAGILVEQADALVTANDDLVPKVIDALQIYVEDSRKKLATYDAIYPKVSAFRDLMIRKLSPKKITIGRDFGAQVSREKEPLTLEGLSSGEKHEFIMLFKLIFETQPESLVLIDEPEISLHVVWQLEFMSDLQRIKEANPFQSIIATHSPQIFQGVKHLLIDLADQA